MPTAVTAGATTDLDILLGFDKPTDAQPKRIVFNYSLEAEKYKVVVLDTRTHRAINNETLDPPNLIDNLDEQLPQKPTASTQELLIVVSAAPVFGPVVIEQIGQPFAQLAIDNFHAHTIDGVPGFTAGDEADPRRKAGCGSRGERGGVLPGAGSASRWWRTRRCRGRSPRRRSAANPSADSRARAEAPTRGSRLRSAVGRSDRRMSSGERRGVGASATASSARPETTASASAVTTGSLRRGRLDRSWSVAPGASADGASRARAEGRRSRAP
jgi:hypothetical protein